MTVSNFSSEYKQIIGLVEQELYQLDQLYDKYFFQSYRENPILPIVREFFANKGKRIRCVLMFLFAKALDLTLNENIYKLAMCNEILHNATLIHDDIIDCAILRRDKHTLNFDYDSKLAVLTGDYLLAQVLNIFNDINNQQVQKIHTETISYLIGGELYQYFNRFKLLSIDEYIEKSKNKTARLFEAILVSLFILGDMSVDKIQKIKDFSLNFGVAFQIDNDLNTFVSNSKVIQDIDNGDYTAPLIYYALEKNISVITNPNLILKNIKKSSAFDRSLDLKRNFIKYAIENINWIEDNQFKQAIVKLCDLYAG